MPLPRIFRTYFSRIIRLSRQREKPHVIRRLKSLKALARGLRHDLSYKSFENRESALSLRGHRYSGGWSAWGGVSCGAATSVGGSRRAEERWYETKYEGNDLKHATPPGQDKQRHHDGAKCGGARRSHFQPCLAVGAGKMGPGVKVKEEWSAHVVTASRTLSHRPDTLPLLYLQCCGHCTVSMEPKEAFSKAPDSLKGPNLGLCVTASPKGAEGFFDFASRTKTAKRDFRRKCRDAPLRMTRGRRCEK